MSFGYIHAKTLLTHYTLQTNYDAAASLRLKKNSEIASPLRELHMRRHN